MRTLVFSVLLAAADAALAATFGSVTPINGGATDIVLDEGRERLYIVNSTQNRIEVYSISQRRLLNPIPTGPFPLAAAMSRDGARLYVTVYDASALEVFDLDRQTLVERVTLTAPPEGVAVGGDERVLITTIGTNPQSSEGRLILFSPYAAADRLRNVVTTLPPPAAASIPAPPSQVFNASRSRLVASADGRYIIGLNNPNQNSRLVFVYEVASGSVLRSRTVTSLSSVLSVASDGSRFMAGLSLFDTATLAILAQMNAANSVYPFPNNVNFNTQQVQGGSLFAPNGGELYAAFNITPVQSPAARANSSQLMIADPDNLLIRMGLQLPENLSGKMVATSDGGLLFALSQSGFLTLPVSQIADSPLALVDNPVAFVTSDQCGAPGAKSTAQVEVRNGGRGQMTVTAQVLQTGPTFTAPIAGAGPGGGAAGVTVPIVIPGGGVVNLPLPGANQGNAAAGTSQQTAVAATAPRVTVRQTSGGATLEFAFNSAVSSSLGTATPTDFLVQSAQAINIPPRVRVYQNYRNAEAVGTVFEVPVSVSIAEGLTDIVADAVRQRLYIANSGLNRIEVFDMREQRFVKRIKVGQLPRSLALHPGGDLLYVANSGGESISIVDLDRDEVVGTVRFPPVPYNAAFALNTPASIAASLSGVQIIMSDGRLWRVVDGQAIPRPASRLVGATALPAPRSMAASPGGEFVLVLAGNGVAYLYDAMADDFVLSQTVASTPIQGYFGSLAAGPRGQYWVVNGNVLNSSLTAVGAAGSTAQVAAAVAVNATTVARFTQPARSSATAAVTSAPTVDLVDANTGALRGSFAAVEGPLSVQTGTARVNINARGMAVDTAGSTAYLLTASGLSIVPLSAPALQDRPAVASNGVLNGASLQPGLAPGSVISIFGRALGDQASAAAPLPGLLGGVCVTLNNRPMPLVMTSPQQINAQIPPDLPTGRYPLIVRAIGKNVASAPQTVTVARYAPAAYTQPSGEAALYHANGQPVTRSNKARRDEPLIMYASGLGVTTGGRVTAGQPSPDSPLAVTAPVKVYFGDPSIREAEVIVDSSSLVPGLVGVYQIALRVPGAHLRGDALPATIRIGGVDSPKTGTVPTVAVD